MSQSNRLVFAHYMVSQRDYGGTVSGYEQDIRDAQAAGIDGFALNIGDWHGGHYRVDTASLFQAAHALNSGFKFFFSVDMTGSISPADITDLLHSYASDPFYWHYGGRPVLSTWSTRGSDPESSRAYWRDQVLGPLRQSGINVYFLPMFNARDYARGKPLDTPAYDQVLNNYQLWWGDVVDGIFYFGGLGSPTDPSTSQLVSSEAYARVLHADGKTFMGAVSPQYWGNKQISAGRRYYEFQGGEGIEAQWNSIIKIQKPDWVELFTWNDFDEATYWSPIDDVNKYWPFLSHKSLDYYKSHAGALALTRYYIDWYKHYPAGTPPPPPDGADNVFFFYRTHSKSAVASNDIKGEVSKRVGTVHDRLYVTTILTAPATLVVSTGDSALSFSMPKGIGNVQVPFNIGPQAFELTRAGKRLLYKEGEPIVASPDEYNFNYYTGSASDK